ncbi:MAG: nuclear transport factor 2 family protein, partial [Candidatus Binatus sp.]
MNPYRSTSEYWVQGSPLPRARRAQARIECHPTGGCSSEKLRWNVMSDRESVLAANRAFYDAFESLDAEKMEAVWLKDPRIICIHPGWRKLSGWG